MQGVQGVDIMFDGDEAGNRAAEAAKGLAESLEMSARVVTLPLNTDPGNLNRDQIERLKKQLYGE